MIGCSKSRLSYLHKEALELINDAWTYQARAERLALFKSAKSTNSSL